MAERSPDGSWNYREACCYNTAAEKEAEGPAQNPQAKFMRGSDEIEEKLAESLLYVKFSM